jgi:hypothetical protein
MEKNKIFNRALLEDHHKECSDEVQMAKIQLKSIMADSADILQQLERCEGLDSWIQSKITMADDYLTTVKKYLQFEEEKPAPELEMIPKGPRKMSPEMGDIGEEPSEDDLGLFSQPEDEMDIEGDLDDAESEADIEDQFAEDDVPDGESMEDPSEEELNESIIMPRLS